MDYEKLFALIPRFIELFVPGFILLSVLRFFLSIKREGFDHDLITSLILSYLMNLLTSVIATYVDIVDSHREISSILISLVVAIICVKIKNAKWFKQLLIKLGFITGNSSIWEDIIDNNRGTHIRLYTQYNNKDAMIDGNVKVYNVLENDCDLALEKYRITFLGDEEEGDVVYEPCKNDEIEAIYFVNTRDINGVEITYGQDVRKSFFAKILSKICFWKKKS